MSKKPPRFEQAIEELETLIDKIESGQVGLEDSIKHYEQGMKLVKQCRSILKTAEKKIAELTVDDAGQLTVDDNNDDSDDVKEPPL